MLLEKVLKLLPEGPRYFPEDQVTDQPVRFMVAEIIREQVLVETEEEVPYATTVVIEQFEEGAKVFRIAAMIYCERDGQKGILVGKGGQMLKKIGTAARLQIEKMLEKRVFLELFVKVRRELAGVARVRRGTRLAPPGGAAGGRREVLICRYFARIG